MLARERHTTQGRRKTASDTGMMQYTCDLIGIWSMSGGKAHRKTITDSSLRVLLNASLLEGKLSKSSLEVT